MTKARALQPSDCFRQATGEGDERVTSLQSRIALVDQFASVRQMAKTDPDQMVAMCERMVDLPDIDSAASRSRVEMPRRSNNQVETDRQ